MYAKSGVRVPDVIGWEQKRDRFNNIYLYDKYTAFILCHSHHPRAIDKNKGGVGGIINYEKLLVRTERSGVGVTILSTCKRWGGWVCMPCLSVCVLVHILLSPFWLKLGTVNQAEAITEL